MAFFRALQTSWGKKRGGKHLKHEGFFPSQSLQAHVKLLSDVKPIHILCGVAESLSVAVQASA